jgi:transposase InsO family protein
VVSECTTCQATALPKGSTLIEGRIKAHREFDVIAIDLLKLPRSTQGHKYALVAVDHFTRYAWVVPVKSKSAHATLEAFLTLDMPVNKPRVLLSDNGTEFCNEIFDQYCKTFGITQHFTVPYHPQSNGVVERFNRTLISMLRAYADESGDNWPLLLKKTLAAYNRMRHPAVGTQLCTSLSETPTCSPSKECLRSATTTNTPNCVSG